MFGYIVVNQPELRIREWEMYHSYYCGLCRILKKKYGRVGQVTLSYDMTFILMLLSGLYDPETVCGKSRCIMHPEKKHEYRCNELTEYVADMNVLLTEYKCLDDWKDDRKRLRLLMARMLGRRTGESRRRYSRKLEQIAAAMEKLSQAEEQGVTDLDYMAGCFGQVMAQIVICREDEWKDNLYRFGFYLGKFVYLLDAYEDLEEDIEKGRYNPLKERYKEPDFEQSCLDILTMMMSACCREFEQLPILDNVEILRNILYSGVWSRYKAVRDRNEVS
ncbi:MAG: hypothetical protein HDR02_17790 [Lachnospiraceae bacterium]|nr:hypothetical protein [Lachnospiraceae bacterium]